MRLRVLFACFVLLSGCASRRAPSPPVRVKLPLKKSSLISDRVLRGHLKREFPRKGKFSTVSSDSVTTERYRSELGETILTLENGELRTETEVTKSGRSITKTWQDGALTGITVTEKDSTTMVVLDEDGSFVHKVMTFSDKPDPECFEYVKSRAKRLPTETCLGLIPGF